MTEFAASFDETVRMAEEWQSLLARISQAMELVQQGEAIPPETAASIGRASQDLCLGLSDLIAGCQVAADCCRSVGKLPNPNFANIGGDVLASRGS